MLGTTVSNPLPNVHLKYTTPDVGLDHRILTARARFNGGSFSLTVTGYLVFMLEERMSVSRIALSIVWLTLGYQLLGVQHEDTERLLLRNVERGVELYVPKEAGNVSYSLRFEGWPVIGTMDALDYDTIPGRVVTKLQ